MKTTLKNVTLVHVEHAGKENNFGSYSIQIEVDAKSYLSACKLAIENQLAYYDKVSKALRPAALRALQDQKQWLTLSHATEVNAERIQLNGGAGSPIIMVDKAGRVCKNVGNGSIADVIVDIYFCDYSGVSIAHKIPKTTSPQAFVRVTQLNEYKADSIGFDINDAPAESTDEVSFC